MQSRTARLIRVEWLTYELKVKIIVVMMMVSALCFLIGVVGVIGFTPAHYVPGEAGLPPRQEMEPNGFIYLIFVSSGMFFVLCLWYSTISKRRRKRMLE